MTTYRVTFTLDVASDRDPQEWDWPALLDVTDDVDTLDESSITVTRIAPEPEPINRYCDDCQAEPGQPCRPDCLSRAESCDHNDDGPCPTCDLCEKSQCEDDSEWDGEWGCHVECLDSATRAAMSTPATCNHGDGETLCLSCGAAWCSTCDPQPAAQCHYCHGRGYSTAEITRPSIVDRDPRVSS